MLCAVSDPAGNVTLELPLPPSTNHLYATVRGQRVLSREGRQYKAEVGWLIRQAISRQQVVAFAPETRLGVALHACISRQRDLDNLAKIVLDSLTDGHLWSNDRWVDWLTLCRCCTRVHNTILLLIAALPEDDRCPYRNRITSHP